MIAIAVQVAVIPEPSTALLLALGLAGLGDAGGRKLSL
ncbi:MAG: PEP-CTERM sorting domain-containing protein [Myxococcota bacterium]